MVTIFQTFLQSGMVALILLTSLFTMPGTSLARLRDTDRLKPTSAAVCRSKGTKALLRCWPNGHSVVGEEKNLNKYLVWYFAKVYRLNIFVFVKNTKGTTKKYFYLVPKQHLTNTALVLP